QADTSAPRAQPALVQVSLNLAIATHVPVVVSQEDPRILAMVTARAAVATRALASAPAQEATLDLPARSACWALLGSSCPKLSCCLQYSDATTCNSHGMAQ